MQWRSEWGYYITYNGYIGQGDNVNLNKNASAYKCVCSRLSEKVNDIYYWEILQMGLTLAKTCGNINV